MRTILQVLFIPVLMSLMSLGIYGADEAKDSLEGVWVAKSAEADGEPAPENVLKNLRFTFKGDQLLLRGNSGDNREEVSSFKIDQKQMPKHLDIIWADKRSPLLAIYEVKGDELKICMRHDRSSKGRPTEFTTKADSDLVLMVFTKQKP